MSEELEPKMHIMSEDKKIELTEENHDKSESFKDLDAEVISSQ